MDFALFAEQAGMSVRTPTTAGQRMGLDCGGYCEKRQ
jgi:hypothetical protein